MINKRRLAIGVSLAILVPAVEAHAAGFSIREQSAEGLGGAFAGIAAGTEGLSAMYWNPATISQHNAQGYVSENNISYILPYSRAKDGAGFVGDSDSGNIGINALVPASYSVYGLTDDIALGLATGAPFGLSTESDLWQGSLHGSESDVFTLNVNPNVAWKIGDMLTVAAGVQGQFMSVNLESENPAAGGVRVFNVQGDDIAFGFTAGILFEPMDGTDIGIGFRSSISHKLEGDGFRAGVYDGDINAKFSTPEIVTIGVKQDITEDLRLMAGVEWANWSRFESLDIKRDDTGAIIASTPQDWDDSWFFSVGGEYDWTEELTVRVGFAYEDSGVPDATRTPRVPDNDRYWLTVGATYRFNNWLTAHLAYSHIFVEDASVNLPAAGGLPPLSANFEQHIDIVSASATIDW
jgi:long-chain fatty acid transport protein